LRLLYLNDFFDLVDNLDRRLFQDLGLLALEYLGSLVLRYFFVNLVLDELIRLRLLDTGLLAEVLRMVVEPRAIACDHEVVVGKPECSCFEVGLLVVRFGVLVMACVLLLGLRQMLGYLQRRLL
jgi:hypothetical protein